MKILHLKNYPIFKQLQLEEALLRLDTSNYCIINEGSPPAIVMGISGNRQELIDDSKLSATPIPVIKRFSGGGTVVVDQDTLFVTFLCQTESHDFLPYPEPIMKWTEEIYKAAFKIEAFHLRENDYAIGERKCGGNAQYLRKGRWLHHTTFLWNYQKELMDLLLHPKKTPSYRADRNHDDFLTCLSEHLPDKTSSIEALKKVLSSHFTTQPIHLEEVTDLINKSHRQSTILL
ncbi:MAG: lipoate--protein ligase family protein [Verrucomicrobia bacterium]|nr:lipoate--protein ligase family protein [Verrucomicrobiota bacterium]